MASTEQILYDQAVHDATFQDVNLTYQKYIEKLRKEERSKFNASMGAYNATPTEKQAFEDRLAEYLSYVIQAHNSFVSKGGRIDPTGGLIIKNQAAADDFDRWIDLAAESNLGLHNFKQQMKNRARFGLNDQVAQSEQNARKNKRRLKTLGAILAAGALGTAAVFGTKAVMDKIGNAEDDVKTDRIEHRVDANKAGIRQGKSYDIQTQNITYATNKSGSFLRTQRVSPQRPTLPDEIVEVETVVEKDVHEQVEEVTAPQLPQVIEKTVIIEKEVPTYVPAPQPTVEPVQTQVEANTIAYQTAMAPAPTVVVAPSPVVQPVPTTVVVDSGPSYTDLGAGIIGGVVGGIVEHALDHHHHRNHHGHIGGSRRAPSPVSFGGRNHGPTHTVRPHRVQGSRNYTPTVRRGGHAVVGGSAIIPGSRTNCSPKRNTMKGTMQRFQNNSKMGGHGGFGGARRGGSMGGRPTGGGRGGRGSRR